MGDYPKISIVTPCFNDAAYLEATIHSLIDQKYPNLEYIIMDGGSTDGSVDIIKRYSNNIRYWSSEKDDGMYHAIQKGFARTSGDIMGWLNSDDIHQAGSLFTVAQIFTDFKEVSWIQGTPSMVDDQNRIVYASPRPDVDRFFFYERKHVRTRRYIQQESTFWRRSLWEAAGGYISQDYKYAGDFELWIRFFKHAKLFNVPAVLGSFRYTGAGQSSIDHYADYVSETIKVIESHPLNETELRQLKRRSLVDKLDKKLSSWIRKWNKLAHQSPSTINDRIYFDGKSQKFRMK